MHRTAGGLTGTPVGSAAWPAGLLASCLMQPSTVLAALAELAPAGRDRVFDVTRGGQPPTSPRHPEASPRPANIDPLAARPAYAVRMQRSP